MSTSAILAFALAFFAFVVYLAITAHVRYTTKNGHSWKAWYIFLPGWTIDFYPEQTVKLNDWKGSGVEGLTVEVDGERNPEIEAAYALQMAGIYGDYTLKQQDEHWVLFRPERRVRRLTFQAPYRISPYQKDVDN